MCLKKRCGCGRMCNDGGTIYTIGTYGRSISLLHIRLFGIERLATRNCPLLQKGKCHGRTSFSPMNATRKALLQNSADTKQGRA
jgi:hypothetical protein